MQYSKRGILKNVETLYVVLNVKFITRYSVVFNSLPPQVVFQEVPDEVSLAFTITGCPLRCEGCHSQDTWNRHLGEPLNLQSFKSYLTRYQLMISCVLFFGGEWCSEQLIEKLICARHLGLKTCLYTGLEKVPQRITQHLDYLKLGAWRSSRGGLNDINTNQRFYNVNTGECLNYRFQNQHQITKEKNHAALI